MLTRRVVFVGGIGLGAFVASFVFYDHLMRISPTTPNPATRQVYELNEHGYLFYVTRTQHSIFFTLLVGGCGLIFIASVLAQLAKRRHKLSSRADTTNI
jgi:hypothetical protein